MRYIKRQVTEDSVHYEHSQPYVPPVDRRRATIEKTVGASRPINPNEYEDEKVGEGLEKR